MIVKIIFIIGWTIPVLVTTTAVIKEKRQHVKEKHQHELSDTTNLMSNQLTYMVLWVVTILTIIVVNCIL